MPKSAASPSILFNIDRLYLRRAQRGVFVCPFFRYWMLLPVRALVCAGSILPRTRAARSSPIFTEKGAFGGRKRAKRAENAAFYKVARSSYLPATRFESARPPQFLIFSAFFLRARVVFCVRASSAWRRPRYRETFVSRLEGWRPYSCRRFSLAPVHCGALIFL